MKNQSVLNLLLFTFFLVIGNFFSSRIYQSSFATTDDTLGWVKIINEKSMQSPKNGQQSVLLIGVDDLESRTPQLESIWLVSYLPSDPELYILPVFPVINENHPASENKLVQAFIYSGSHAKRLDKNFINILKEANYWWSGYVIFDHSTVMDLAKVLGQDKGYEQKGALNHTAKPFADEIIVVDTQSSKQLSIIRTACQRLSEIHEITDQAQIISFISNHVATDLDVSKFISEWSQKLSTPQSQYCRYPTMQASGIDD